jgi:hypothetical protein
MGINGIQRAGSLISVFILILLISYVGSARFPLFGSLYLILASYLSLFSMIIVTKLRRKLRSDNPEPAAGLLHTRANVLLLSASQVAIIGLLNILGFGFSGSTVSIILGYVLAGGFMILSYKQVAIIDRPAQEGGSKPLSFFGRPRSRRLVFCALIYSPIGPLIVLSLIWSDWKWCPTLLRIPNIWLLVSAMLALISAGLAFQRYREAGTRREWATQIVVVTMVVLGLTGFVDILLEYSVYMYALSSIAIVGIAATVYWLSLAREDGLMLPQLQTNGEKG